MLTTVDTIVIECFISSILLILFIFRWKPKTSQLFHPTADRFERSTRWWRRSSTSDRTSNGKKSPSDPPKNFRFNFDSIVLSSMCSNFFNVYIFSIEKKPEIKYLYYLGRLLFFKFQIFSTGSRTQGGDHFNRSIPSGDAGQRFQIQLRLLEQPKKVSFHQFFKYLPP